MELVSFPGRIACILLAFILVFGLSFHAEMALAAGDSNGMLMSASVDDDSVFLQNDFDTMEDLQGTAKYS